MIFLFFMSYDENIFVKSGILCIFALDFGGEIPKLQIEAFAIISR